MPKRIAALDGVRGLAALMVFLDHRLSSAHLLYIGGYGVQIFFVLSGFLIIGILHGEQKEIALRLTTPFAAWRTFLVRRAGRILPLWVTLFATICLISTAVPIAHFSAWEIPIYGLFLTNIYIAQVGHFLGPVRQSWSLAVEEQFYLVAAPLLLALPPQRTRWICLGTAALAFCWHMSLVMRFPDTLMLRTDSFSNFGFFAIGGALALRRSSPLSRTAGGIQMVLFLGVAAIPFLPGALANPVIRQLIQPLLVALLLAELRDHQDTKLACLLSNHALVGLGTISYGFYLLHEYITGETLRAITFGWIDITHWPSVAQFLPLFVLSVIAAALSWRYLEKPLLARARQYQSVPTRPHCGAPSIA